MDGGKSGQRAENFNVPYTACGRRRSQAAEENHTERSQSMH